MKRIMPLLLAVLILTLAFTGCAAGEISLEANTEYRPDQYPYMLHTESATWFIAKEDIDLIGMDAVAAGLERVLEYQEADFADARNALEGYLEDVPPIVIYTDFCNQFDTPFNDYVHAYYNHRSKFIRVGLGWDSCNASLLHEYVHYLTYACTPVTIMKGFWAEGIADYISKYVCKNRLTRSVHLGYDLSVFPPEALEQTWIEEDNSPDPRLFCMGTAARAANGDRIGERYLAVRNEPALRTEEIQRDLHPQDLMYEEAAGMVAYLVEVYGKDTVFRNWDVDPEHMETVYGKTFSELYREWAAWNEEQCRQAGLVVR